MTECPAVGKGSRINASWLKDQSQPSLKCICLREWKLLVLLLAIQRPRCTAPAFRESDPWSSDEKLSFRTLQRALFQPVGGHLSHLHRRSLQILSGWRRWSLSAVRFMETINQRPERTHQHFPLLEIMGRYNANLANEQPGWQRVFFPSALSSLLPPPHGSSATAATVRSPSGRGAVPTSPSACWRTAPNGTAPHRDAAPRGGTGGLPRRPRPKRLRRKAPELCPAQPSPTPPGAASQSRLTALAPDPHPRVTALPHRPPHRLLRAVGSGPVRSGPALTHSLTHHGTDGGDFGDCH